MKFLAVALISVGLAGCGINSADPPAPGQTITNAGGVEVNAMTLPDGTRCAFIKTTQGVALTCDWTKP